MWLRAVVMLAFASPAAAQTVVTGGHVADGYDHTPHPVISAGVGVDGFLAGTARSHFDPGPSWNVRLGLLDMSAIRVELAYNGSSQPATVGDATLIAHGVVGLVRINVTPRQPFETFFYTGGGWTRFHVTGTSMRELRSPDHVLEIPFGIGVARRWGRLVIDARAGMSVMSASHLIADAESSENTEGAGLHRFGARANIGFEL